MNASTASLCVELLGVVNAHVDMAVLSEIHAYVNFNYLICCRFVAKQHHYVADKHIANTCGAGMELMMLICLSWLVPLATLTNKLGVHTSPKPIDRQAFISKNGH